MGGVTAGVILMTPPKDEYASSCRRVRHVGTTGLWAYLIHPRGWVPLWKWAPAMMTAGVLLLQARGAEETDEVRS